MLALLHRHLLPAFVIIIDIESFQTCQSFSYLCASVISHKITECYTYKACSALSSVRH